jgi:hypothetical protein
MSDGRITMKIECDTRQAREALEGLRKQMADIDRMRARSFRRRLLLVALLALAMAAGLAIGLVMA